MTQGIVAITKDGKVAIKIIAGCNGRNASRLAKVLEKLGDSIISSPPIRDI